MLKISVAGYELSARWEQERSPRTVAFVKTMLPYDSQLIQARWSGQSAWIPMGDYDVGDLGPEDPTSYPAPGQLLLYPGGVSEVEILFPYATIEPIREQMLQMYMGEKFGRDPIWEGHLATEIYAADVEIEAVMHEVDLPLSRILSMRPGDTVIFDRTPTEPIKLRCGGIELTEGIMGHIGKNVSVRVARKLNPPKVTMAAFEALDERAEGR